MTKFNVVILFVLMSVLPGLQAQNSSARTAVVAAAGDQYAAGDIQLDWTLGEVSIETLQNNTNMITQGFHQGEYAMKNTVMANPLDLDVTIFPNPSFDHMMINIKDNHPELLLQFFNIEGKLLVSESITESKNTHRLDLAALEANTYILQIRTIDAKYQSSYKVIKLN